MLARRNFESLELFGQDKENMGGELHPNEERKPARAHWEGAKLTERTRDICGVQALRREERTPENRKTKAVNRVPKKPKKKTKVIVVGEPLDFNFNSFNFSFSQGVSQLFQGQFSSSQENSFFKSS